MFIVFLLIAPTVMIGVGRGGETARNYWEFNGIISDKLVSNNHDSKSLIVEGKEYEPIPLNIWNDAKVGQNIKKEVCGSITLNGKEYKFGKQKI